MGDTEPKGMLSSKVLIKRSEFIRIITDALTSLGFDDTGAHLEQNSGILLQTPPVNLFLEQVKNGEWDESIASLQVFQIDDEKGQKARTASGEDTEMDTRSKVLEKVKKLYRQLNSCAFHNHPDPIDALYLFSEHHCQDPKIPSVTVQILEDHTDEVWFLKYSHSGKYLASSSKDKTAIIWEINAEGELVLKHKLEGHEKPVVAVLWSPDDQEVITCGEDENIRLWDVDTGEFVHSYKKDGVCSVSCG